MFTGLIYVIMYGYMFRPYMSL